MQTGGKLMKAKFKVLERAKSKIADMQCVWGEPCNIKANKVLIRELCICFSVKW